MGLYTEYLQTKKGKADTVAKNILFGIVGDLTNRRGLRQEFDWMEGDMKDIVLEKWLKIIESNL